jgi:hypothetical protein
MGYGSSAARVYSMDLGRVIDRTKEEHPLGGFDVDFRSRGAPNPQARNWTYGATARTRERAVKDAEYIRRGLEREGQYGVETRIVDARTGRVLSKDI